VYLQPLLRNTAQKLPNLPKWRILHGHTPFRVIQDHRFWYHSKVYTRLPISD